MRMPYPEARIFLHPALSAAQADHICRRDGLEIVQDGCGHLSIEQKRARAIAYLRSRGLYVLDQGTPAPGWAQGHKDDPEAA